MVFFQAGRASASIWDALMLSWKRVPIAGASAFDRPTDEQARPAFIAGYTYVPESQLIVMNSAWSMWPAASSGSRMIPARLPKRAAVASEPRPSPSIRVLPPHLADRVPPPEGLDVTPQRSYSTPAV